MFKASILPRQLKESGVAKLPPDYTIGVQCSTFEGMLLYQGKPFIMWGCFMRWSEVETYSLRQLLGAIKNGTVYYARKKAKPIRRPRGTKPLPSPKHS